MVDEQGDAVPVGVLDRRLGVVRRSEEQQRLTEVAAMCAEELLHIRSRYCAPAPFDLRQSDTGPYVDAAVGAPAVTTASVNPIARSRLRLPVDHSKFARRPAFPSSMCAAEESTCDLQAGHSENRPLPPPDIGGQTISPSMVRACRQPTCLRQVVCCQARLAPAPDPLSECSSIRSASAVSKPSCRRRWQVHDVATLPRLDYFTFCPQIGLAAPELRPLTTFRAHARSRVNSLGTIGALRDFGLSP